MLDASIFNVLPHPVIVLTLRIEPQFALITLLGERIKLPIVITPISNAPGVPVNTSLLFVTSLRKVKLPVDFFQPNHPNFDVPVVPSPSKYLNSIPLSDKSDTF